MTGIEAVPMAEPTGDSGNAPTGRDDPDTLAGEKMIEPGIGSGPAVELGQYR